MEIYKAKAWKEKLNSNIISSKDFTEFIKYFGSFVDEVQDYYDRSVSWGIDDFEFTAKKIEERDFNEGKCEASEIVTIYDRTKFQDILHEMISKHDANIGITWDSIEYYLNEYCKLKDTNYE